MPHVRASRFAPSSSLLFAAPLLLLAGCGNQYRPVVTATNPVGPAAQPTRYAVVVSDPGNNQPGLVTFVDYSGDTIISTPSIQTSPNYLALNQGGNYAFTINANGTFDSFGASNPAGLITSNIDITTLNAAATPQTISPINLSGSSATVFVPEPGLSRVAALTSVGSLVQEIGIPGAGVPTYVVGADSASRIYALSSAGTASALEASTTAGISVTSTIQVGTNPTYGVMTADGRRAFVLNKGSQSVSVINVINNALDQTTSLPTGTIDLTYRNPLTGLVTTYGQNPVWADFSVPNNEIAVLSAGDGTNPGLLTLISIPLCNAQVQPGAGSTVCDATNPVDGKGFGTIVAQIPVGVNATQVSTLNDTTGSKAYVSNAGNCTSVGVPTGCTQGSVSVVNVTSGVLTKTLTTSVDNATNLSTATVYGLHPSTIVTSWSSPTGKVYVTSPDSRYLTIIYTDTDTVTTHVPLQGAGVRVAITAK